MPARFSTRARDASMDAGVTMLEVLLVMVLAGLLTAIAVWGIRGWATSSAFKGTSQQVQSLMRTTQQRAITEGTSYCVQFNTTTDEYAVFRLACTDDERVQTTAWFGTGSDEVHLVDPVFLDSAGIQSTGVTFTPRGSAWPGQVLVTRGSSMSTAVMVEGMTGRVSLG